MGDKSKIEWTEATWNPIVGCSVISPGCTNCYAMKMAARLEAMATADRPRWTPAHRNGQMLAHYVGTTKRVNGNAVWTGKVALAPERILLQPLRWKKPRTIFVNSMSDLFHESVPDEWIDRVFAVMALCPQHTFQVLTKRAERMLNYINGAGGVRLVKSFVGIEARKIQSEFGRFEWPLPNVWLGVSAEDQKRADERIPHLLQTPAAVRFISAEPLLEQIDFALSQRTNASGTKRGIVGAGVDAPTIDWVIVGGESGPNARPMHPDWARSIRDQCQAAGVPFFFKQWGEHVTGYLDGEDFHVDEEAHGPSVTWNGTARCHDIPGESGHYGRVGKRAAGRLLDGREHNEMPERA